MIVLDTDHISVLTDRNHRQFDTLTHRMLAVDEESFTSTIVTAEEVMRGWLAYIHRQKALPRHVVAYARLSRFLEFFAQWNRLPFDEEAAQEFQRLRKARVRIGAMDLKIASIVLANGATLLTANQKDFGKIRRLTIENWLN